MTIQLAEPVAAYIAAANDGRTGAFDGIFADDAIVRDEGHTYAGLPAIRKWSVDTKAKYQAVMAPLKSTERDGMTVVNMRLTGNFPGSPVDVDFHFSLAGDRITRLAIGG